MDKEHCLPEQTAGHETSREAVQAGHEASSHQHIIELQPVTFSAKAIQHGRHPTHRGRLACADTQASKVGWCGEVMEMYLRFDHERIAEATFWADGCLSTMACGDMLTTLIEGLTPENAVEITPDELIAALDGLPYKSHHCAELSVETLREALANSVRT